MILIFWGSVSTKWTGRHFLDLVVNQEDEVATIKMAEEVFPNNIAKVWLSIKAKFRKLNRIKRGGFKINPSF